MAPPRLPRGSFVVVASVVVLIFIAFVFQGPSSSSSLPLSFGSTEEEHDAFLLFCVEEVTGHCGLVCRDVGTRIVNFMFLAWGSCFTSCVSLSFFLISSFPMRVIDIRTEMRPIKPATCGRKQVLQFHFISFSFSFFFSHNLSLYLSLTHGNNRLVMILTFT